MGTNSTLIAGIRKMVLRAVLPASAALVAASAIPLPAACGDTPSSVTESSRTYKDPVCNLIIKDLENEIAETTTSLKTCGDQSSYAETSADKSKECAGYERKLRLTKANLLHVKEQCDKGLTPDSLPKVADDPDLVPCSHCGADKLLPREPSAKIPLTGLPMAGNVADLKAGDPSLSAKLDTGVTPLGAKAAAQAASACDTCNAAGQTFWQSCLETCCNEKGGSWCNQLCTKFPANPKCSGGTVPPLCSANQDLVNGNCVPKCTGGQTRNAGNGECECPAGQVFSAGKCGCPSGQTLTVEGKCVASDGGDGGAVQPPAKKPGLLAKVGNFLKAIWNGVKAAAKAVWNNILKPIVDFFADIYHKIKGDTEKCGEAWYNPDKTCCVNGTAVEKCGGECYDPGKYCCVEGKPQEKCGGECYNSKNTCCTDGKKSDDKFLDKEFPLENCPYRIARTEDRKGVSNGCSVPAYAKPGLQAIAWGRGEGWIGNYNDPVGGGESTTFLYACDAHDACYATCNNPTISNLLDSAYSEQCDEKRLKVKMNDVCDNLKDPKVKASCNFWEITYLAGVWLKGEAHYTVAQKEWCKCCPVGSK